MKYILIVVVAVIGLFIVLNNNDVEHKNLQASAEKLPTSENKIASVKGAELPLKTNSITRTACINQLQIQQSSSFLREKKAALIKQNFISIPKKKRTAKRLALIAELAGLSRLEGIKHQPRYDDNDRPMRLFKTDNAVELSMTVAAKVVNMIKQQDYAGLSNGIVSKDITINGHILSNSILSIIIDIHPTVNYSQLQLVLSAGFPVFLGDLILATKAGLEQNAIELLHSHSSVDPKQVWQFQSRSNSLSTIAIESLHHELLTFWLSKGSPVLSSKNDINGLNYIPLPKGDSQTIAALSIYQQLIAAGINSASQFSISTLNTWLPEKLQQEQTLIEDVPSVLDDEVIAASMILKQLVADIDAQIHHSELSERECQENYNMSYLSEVELRGDLFAKQQSANHPVSYSRHEQRLRYFDMLEKMSNMMNEEQLGNAEQIVQVPFSKSWHETLKNTIQLQDSLGEQDTEYYDLLLMQAIQGGADIDFIEKLFTYGATLNEITILSLTHQNRLTLTKQLMRFGLDLHFVDDTGKNALSYSVISSNSKPMFDFLLNNSVSVNPSQKGLDPLDLALLAITRFETAIDYAVGLIARNAKIEKSHFQQVELIKLTHPKRYEQIVNKLPVLTNKP